MVCYITENNEKMRNSTYTGAPFLLKNAHLVEETLLVSQWCCLARPQCGATRT